MVVPGLLLVLITIGVIAPSEQTVCEEGVATPTGSGLTVTVAVNALPAQPSVVGVIVKVTNWEVPVTLFSEPETSPLPDAAMPVTLPVLLRVHAYVVPLKLLLVLITIVVIVASEQTVCEEGVDTPTGSGLTVTVAVNALPTQPSVVGMIVYVTVCEVPVTLFGVPVISVVPLAARLVTLIVLSRVHAYVVPLKLLLVPRVIVVIVASEHTVCEVGEVVPTGSGLTVTVAVKALPTHPSVVGVIVKVTVCEIPVTLFIEPDTLPLPESDIPVTLTVLLRVHAYVVPLKLLLVLITMVVIVASEQTVCEEGVDTPTGSGLTVTVAVNALPTHPSVVGMIVKVTVWLEPVTLFSEPEMFPVPDAAKPVTLTVLSRDHA